jgi:hypothetical protein
VTAVWLTLDTPTAIMAANTVSDPFARQAPVVSGTPRPGRTLTCEPAGWSGAVEVEVRWRIGRDPETTPTPDPRRLTVREADVGRRITCIEVAVNEFGGAIASAESIGVVATPRFVRKPGLRRDGGTLRCSPGTYRYAKSRVVRWLRDGKVVPGTGQSRAIRTADAGHALRCRVEVRGPGGRATATSIAVRVPASFGRPGP